ncbi:sesquipedalian-1-like isoform X2 [Ambystoma mexicanum]
MKFHERSVLPYCHGASPVDKEGYLQKKGELNTSYQRRWFVLKGNLLFYFERRFERDPLGFIVLEGCSVELCESEEEFAFALVYKDPGLRMYKMAAESQASLEAWIKVLLAASYNYLKMLVGDLQRQYKELCPSTNEAVFPCDTLLTLLSPDSFLCVPGSGEASKTGRGRSQSTGAVESVVQAKPPKKSPKMWAKRVHPAPNSTRVEAPHSLPRDPAVGPEDGGTIPWEEFAQLHMFFGEQVLLLRRTWQEQQAQQRGPDVPDEADKDLIDWG